jgi:hypothetical protein
MKTAVVLELLQRARELAQRLGHQACLQADVAVAHLALDLRSRRQRRDRVHDDDVDRRGAHQHVGDLERLLAGVGLGHEQLVDVDPERLGVGRVERVLGIDERSDAAGFCASAIACNATVVLPELSGPKISTTRPRGSPPTPRAMSSSDSAPVGIAGIS